MSVTVKTFAFGRALFDVTELHPASEAHEDFGDVLWYAICPNGELWGTHFGSQLETDFPYEEDDERFSLFFQHVAAPSEQAFEAAKQAAATRKAGL